MTSTLQFSRHVKMCAGCRHVIMNLIGWKSLSCHVDRRMLALGYLLGYLRVKKESRERLGTMCAVNILRHYKRGTLEAKVRGCRLHRNSKDSFIVLSLYNWGISQRQETQERKRSFWGDG